MKTKNKHEALDIYTGMAAIVSAVLLFLDFNKGLKVAVLLMIPTLLYSMTIVLIEEGVIPTNMFYKHNKDYTTNKIINHAIKKDLITKEHIDMAVYSACSAAYVESKELFETLAHNKNKHKMFKNLKENVVNVIDAPVIRDEQNSRAVIEKAKQETATNNTTSQKSVLVENEKPASGTKVKYDLAFAETGYQLKEGALNIEIIPYEATKQVETMEELKAMPSEEVTAYCEQEDRTIYFFIDIEKALVIYK